MKRWPCFLFLIFLGFGARYEFSWTQKSCVGRSSDEIGQRNAAVTNVRVFTLGNDAEEPQQFNGRRVILRKWWINIGLTRSESRSRCFLEGGFQIGAANSKLLFNWIAVRRRDGANESMNEWIDGWFNEWMNEWMNRWMDRWMDGVLRLLGLRLGYH